MVFAFDLDRTMIFSKAALEGCMENTVCIEYKGEEDISYMSVDGLLTVIKLANAENLVCVPTTTRSIEQFKRVKPFSSFKWVITTNGGVILHYGKVYEPWDLVVKSYLKDCYKSLENAIEDIKDKDFVLREPKIVDDTFVFFTTEDKVACSAYLDSYLDGTSLNYTIQGRKVYIIPKGISKESAISYIMSLLEETHLVTAGDGKLDKGMLSMGECGYIPDGSEVLEYISDEDWDAFNYKVVASNVGAIMDISRNLLKE